MYVCIVPYLVETCWDTLSPAYRRTCCSSFTVCSLIQPTSSCISGNHSNNLKQDTIQLYTVQPKKKNIHTMTIYLIKVVTTHLILNDKADSRGRVYGSKMAESILTGNKLLRDCKGLCLSLQASTRAKKERERERLVVNFHKNYVIKNTCFKIYIFI